MTDDARKLTYWIAGVTALGVLVNTAACIRYVKAEPSDPREFYRAQVESPVYSRAHPHHVSGDPRPSRWCGWWLRQRLGVADRAFNLARKWASYGRPASGPAPGVIAVWPHHVGQVTSVPGPGRIIMISGNDGHAVRERERSTRGVIAWRTL